MSRIALRKVKFAQNQLTRGATRLRMPTSRPTCTRPHNHARSSKTFPRIRPARISRVGWRVWDYRVGFLVATRDAVEAPSVGLRLFEGRFNLFLYIQ
jgi:hypothetical protein